MIPGYLNFYRIVIFYGLEDVLKFCFIISYLPTSIHEHVSIKSEGRVEAVNNGLAFVSDDVRFAGAKHVSLLSQDLCIVNTVGKGDIILVWNNPLADAERHSERVERCHESRPAETLSSLKINWLYLDVVDGDSANVALLLGARVLGNPVNFHWIKHPISKPVAQERCGALFTGNPNRIHAGAGALVYSVLNCQVILGKWHQCFVPWHVEV